MNKCVHVNQDGKKCNRPAKDTHCNLHTSYDKDISGSHSANSLSGQRQGSLMNDIINQIDPDAEASIYNPSTSTSSTHSNVSKASNYSTLNPSELGA